MRQRHKSCAHCGATAPVLFRTRHYTTAPWIFVCEACFLNLKQNYPDYTYGGTWKATKK